ncbi:hypothetical protein [Pedobacter xixiisoli]|uniref:Uncharacterized protein n=1 Tax=Pedobacter xixiisoli TaxID=1476464 RepID=A0A285ZNJ5_9SPHI|nr:hypothetical protein [Pedobacter xixiisoli]SOD11225.1 hypothetical protein SAMN06297358_0043 [Pedobacter xixiisoli]
MKQSILGVFVLLLFSCSSQESKKADTPTYFNLASYFEGEISRLQKTDPTIAKSVIAAGRTEQLAIKINDWKTELSSFSTADINKASWKGEFTETVIDGNINYTTSNLKIPIKRIEILKANNQIKGIKIFKTTKNYLYTSTDTLLYYPDSLYFIQNLQDITFLGEKRYQVTGKFK